MYKLSVENLDFMIASFSSINFRLANNALNKAEVQTVLDKLHQIKSNIDDGYFDIQREYLMDDSMYQDLVRISKECDMYFEMG